VQAVAGYVVNFVFLVQPFASPGFLVNAAPNALQMNVASLLLPLSGALWIAIAITAFPVFRQYSQSLALWFLALAVVACSGILAESIALRSLLALSQEYAQPGAIDAASFQAPVAVVRSVRNSAHYMDLLVSAGTLITFYSLLLRSALIPRVLSALGLATVSITIVGAVIPLLGYPTMLLMLMPMGLVHLAVTAWLIARGFEHRAQQLQSSSTAGVLQP
jgi:hypothetical protein